MPAKKPYRPKPSVGRSPDPDDVWNELELDPQASIDLAQETLRQLNDPSAGAAWDCAFQFFSDVSKRIAEVRDTIKLNGKVSAKQHAVLVSWDSAVMKTINKHKPRTT